jgi:localization factor PodJL
MASRVNDDSAKPDESAKADRDDADTSARKAAADKTSPTASKTPRRRPSTSKKARAESIQSELDALEARLKHAEDVTTRSVGSLETVVSALEANLKKNTAAQKGRLTRHVNELTERLDRQTAQMREAVRSELKRALADGDIENVDAALGRAAVRLDRAELAQADAITRVNKHLADIARAVDARMKAETQARKDELDELTVTLTTAIATSRSEIESRVDVIERDSSSAFEKVGDTIEKIHHKLEQRREASNKDIIAQVNALAKKTQADLAAHQTRLEGQLADVEARYLAVGTGAAERVVEKAREDIEATLKVLKSRIAELEKNSTETKSETATQATQATPIALTPEKPKDTTATPAKPDIKLAPLPPLPELGGRQNPDETPSHTDPFVPTIPSQDHSTRSFQERVSSKTARRSLSNNPYAAALQSDDLADTDQGAVDASAFLPTPSPSAPTPAAPTSIVPFPSGPSGTPPLPPFQMPSALHPAAPADDFESAPVPDAVYSNPAYAEEPDPYLPMPGQMDTPQTMRVVDDSPKRKLSLPSLNNRTLRIGLLASGVAIVAILAGRMILGTSDITDPNVTGGGTGQAVVTTDPGARSMPLTAVGPDTRPSLPARQSAADPNRITTMAPTPVIVDPNAATAPIGNYTEQRPVAIPPENLETLDAAVAAGNPIAQFQKGLAELDAGRTDAGATLIRQAASANQPAALYRLAKLYEAGEGVPRDDVMARQLIERAARGGNRIAMHDLALYYTEGRGGVDLDMIAAKSWFEQAARRGVVDSQFNLAILSESTETGVDPDLETALFWYSVAAEQGDQFAVSRRDALSESLGVSKTQDIQDRVEAFSPVPIDEQANGIFEDVPWVKEARAPSQTQVREVQTLLATLGYSVGTPDGVMGARTRSAITEFERANGLTETGEVNGALINRLSNAVGT